VRKVNPWLSLIPVAMGVFMVLIDTSVLNIALPSIAQEFKASASDVEWILNAYTITLVVLLIPFGRIGDMVRRDLLYCLGMSIFAFGSYLCAQSWNINVFILFRVIQAVGGAVISGNAVAMLAELFPPGKRGLAMGVQSILIATGFSVGPVLGGWITTHLGWHWVFYINVPVGAISIILGLTLLPSLGEGVREPIDFVGVTLLAMGLGFLTLGLIKGQEWGWNSEKTIASFLIAFPYILAFAVRELTCDYPILDFSLFKIRNFATCIVALFFMFMGLSLSMFLLPFFLQGIKGLTAEEAGYWVLPISILNTVVAPIAGRLSDRINPKIIMCIGPIIFSTALYLLSHLEIGVSFWELAPILAMLGIGMGLVMAPAMNVMITAVPPQKAGMASGTIRTFNTLAQAMGVAFGGVLFTGKMNDLIPNYGNQLPSPMQIKLLGVLAMKGFGAPLVIITEAFMRCFREVFVSAIPLTLAGFLIILLFLRGEEHIKIVKRARSALMMV